MPFYIIPEVKKSFDAAGDAIPGTGYYCVGVTDKGESFCKSLSKKEPVAFPAFSIEKMYPL